MPAQGSPQQRGEAVLQQSAARANAAGIAGAPRTGDTAAWAPRLKQGFDLLVKHAVEGFKTMPPKGGNPNLDPIEVARAVAFIANQSGGKFKEPAAPAATAPSAPPPPRQYPPRRGPPTPPPIAASASATTANVKVDGAKVFASGCNVCTPLASPVPRSSATSGKGAPAWDTASMRRQRRSSRARVRCRREEPSRMPLTRSCAARSSTGGPRSSS